jgi:hypothetical protein
VTYCADDAARWATRILDSGLVGAVGHALITERISACYSIRTGIGTYKLGSRRRKAAFWAVLAAEHWWHLDKSLQAEKALDAALRLYNVHVENHSGGRDSVTLPFGDMQTFVDELRQHILGLRLSNQEFDGAEGKDMEEGAQSPQVEEVLETLNASPRAHRKSLIGAAVPNIDGGALSPALERRVQDADAKAEGFE